MGRVRLVLGIVASLAILLVGAQIIVSGNAFMPFVASRYPRALFNVRVSGFPAYLVGMAWLCGGLSILANVASNRIGHFSSRLITLRNILLVLLGVSFLAAVVAQIGRVYGNSAF